MRSEFLTVVLKMSVLLDVTLCQSVNWYWQLSVLVHSSSDLCSPRSMIGLLDPEAKGITQITKALPLPSLLGCYAMLSHKYFLMVRRIICIPLQRKAVQLLSLDCLTLNIRNGLNQYGAPSHKTWILNNWNLLSAETGDWLSHKLSQTKLCQNVGTLVVMSLTNRSSIVMFHMLCHRQVHYV